MREIVEHVGNLQITHAYVVVSNTAARYSFRPFFTFRSARQWIGNNYFTNLNALLYKLFGSGVHFSGTSLTDLDLKCR
jgi:hypothetical protein